MASELTRADVDVFLQELGKRYTAPAALYLVGGGALLLLDSPRGTLDVDYVGHDMPSRWNELQRVIDALGNEMGIKIEAVPLDDMIPLPLNSAQRHLPVGAFGSIQVYIFDPYAIALSKLDRGNESDMQDIVFLIRRNYIYLDELDLVLRAAIPSANQFDMNPKQMQKNLDTVRQMLKR
jgi:hypothetical protein